jgi:hypothetical protein
MNSEKRIESLEGQVRTLKRIVYGFACLLVAGIALATTSVQDIPDLIQAKKFEVIDKEGKAVGHFSAGTNGGKLNIFNKKGNSVAGLTSGKNGGGLVIMSNDERILAGLTAHEDGGGLIIYNNQMKTLFRIPEKEAAEN